jgi:hypothetical protein
MIVRIGDQKRAHIEEHLTKLRDYLTSDDTMKHQRHQTVHTVVSALTNLPHKAFVYGALITMINIHSTHLANEIVTHMIEQLSLSLVSERNVHASKNIMRVLAVLVELGCLASGWFSQTVI